MNGFWKRRDELEGRLRSRHVPRDTFVQTLAAHVSRSGRKSSPRTRLGLATGLSTLLIVALGASGGLGYASTATHSALVAPVKIVKKIVVPTKHHSRVKTTRRTSGSAQYKPGCGQGDKNHIHTGPPGQIKKGATSTCPPFK